MPISQERIFALVTLGNNLERIIASLNREYQSLIREISPSSLSRALVIANTHIPAYEDIKTLASETAHYRHTAVANDRKRRYMQKKRGTYKAADPFEMKQASRGPQTHKPYAKPFQASQKLTEPQDFEEMSQLTPSNLEAETPQGPQPGDEEAGIMDPNSSEYQEFMESQITAHHKAGLSIEIPISIPKDAGKPSPKGGK